MRIQIARDGDQILTESDYRDIKDSGEIAHFITELEIFKQDMLELWEQYHEYDKT